MKTCGLDVHKDMIFCAIYDGKDSVIEKLNTFTPDLESMCGYILSQGVDTVAMESTGIYISAVRTVLRQHGMRAMVVNPYLIKQMPGRKSDVKDSVWIATLMYNGMLGESFLPDGALARLRAYTRDYRRSVNIQLLSLHQIVASQFRSCLNVIDEFYYGHGRADFSPFRWSDVSQSERKRCLYLLLSQIMNVFDNNTILRISLRATSNGSTNFPSAS